MGHSPPLLKDGWRPHESQQSLALPFDTPAGPCHHRRHLIGRSSLNGHSAAFTISGPFLLGSGAAPAGIQFLTCFPASPLQPGPLRTAWAARGKPNRVVLRLVILAIPKSMARHIVSIPKRGISNVARKTGGSHAQVRFCCYGRLNRGGVGRVDLDCYYGTSCSACERRRDPPIQMMASSPKLPPALHRLFACLYGN